MFVSFLQTKQKLIIKKIEVMLRTFIGTLSLFAVVILAGFFTSCQQEDNLTDVENFVLQSTTAMEDQCGAGRAGCYELVFPVTIQFADSTTTTVGSYDEMKQVIREWFQANGGQPGNGGHGHHGHHGGLNPNKPTLVLPIQVINEAGEIITIETIEELQEIRALCNPGGGGGNGGHGGAPCFTLNFPITVMFADSSVVTVNSKEELREATHAWHQNNPGQRPHPEFVFPISVTLEDGTVVTVNSREELRALKEACRG
jgi:hypothetical protein